MDSWLKRLVLTIAAFLGLAEAADPPPLSLRPVRDDEAIYASLELEGPASGDLARLVDATFTLRVRAIVWAGDTKGEAFRDIRYDGRRYAVLVSETGGTHAVGDFETAWLIASRFARIPLGGLAQKGFPLAVGAKVTLEFPDDPEYDAMVVWGYRPAAAYLELDAPGMAPYY